MGSRDYQWFCLVIAATFGLFVQTTQSAKHRFIRYKRSAKFLKQPIVDCKTPTSTSRLPRKIILTFDDGPTQETERFLQLLGGYGIKAVFFINGYRLKLPNSPAHRWLQAAANAGHLIGNHTINHPTNLCRLTLEQVSQEILGNADIIQTTIGRQPDLFRSPYGLQCQVVKEVQTAHYLTHIGWEIDSNDWKFQNPEDLYNHLVDSTKAIRPGNITVILAHDTSTKTRQAYEKYLLWVQEENKRCDAKGSSRIDIIDPYLLLKRSGTKIPGKKYTEQIQNIPVFQTMWKLISGTTGSSS